MASGTRLALLLLLLLLLERLASGCRDTHLPRKCESLCIDRATCELRIGVLLPGDPQYEISQQKVRPVLDMAVKKARLLGYLPPWLKVKFLIQDERCDATYALLGALTSFSSCVHAFFGPTCDYSVANVGRITKFLNTPLITTGAFTYDFTQQKKNCQDEYYMTTRVGSLAFRDIANFFIKIMDRYQWKKVHLLYDTNGQSSVTGRHTCQLMMKSMVEFIKKRQDLDSGNMNIEASPVVNYPDILREHVGTTYGGECAYST